MKTRPIPAIKFLIQVCAIKNAKEFWKDFPLENFKEQSPERKDKSTFVVASYEKMQDSTIVYKVCGKNLIYSQWQTVTLLHMHLKKSAVVDERIVRFFNDEEFNEEYKNYRGPLIVLIPPDSSEFTLEEEKFEPAYVRSKIGQLHRAIKRIQANCPHKNYSLSEFSSDLATCDDCAKIINPF
ncbi:hypothetical protein L6259_00890 [Candidatus Parcubacteria bacterium]|nr:hypothetical protein [Patescibacteria group bacterium]MCG2693829.1 hypothetical protein [Candidatus Parcubacteria bacterium]